METKIERRFFMLPDFIEEQDFLIKQHALGWKFVSFNGFNKYTFEKCQPEDYCYQLDYKEDTTDEESYLQLFEDCGWEYIMKYNHFYYFRKTNPTKDEDMSIFSDMTSKVNMITSVFKKQQLLFLTTLPLFFFVLYSFITSLIFDKSSVFLIVYSIITALYIFVMIIHVTNYLKLQKLIASLK